MSSSYTLVKKEFSDLPNWKDGEFEKALQAFRRSAFRVDEKPYRTGAFGLSIEDFQAAFQAVKRDIEDPQAFFEKHFQPFEIIPEEAEHGFVTGFFEPIVEASRVRTDRFTISLLKRPDDLIDLDETNRPSDMDPYLAFGRQGIDGIEEYDDRAAIENGALTGQGLEIAWLEDGFEAFLIHVQGAARLRFADGEMRVTYAAKSGQRFTGPGSVLCDLGELQRETVTLVDIRAWFRSHPSRQSEILQRNRSYIFFREAEVSDPALGPVAAAKVPLTPGISLAVDRLIHTFGTPFFIHAPDLDVGESSGFSRLMIAQDTGSAIVGPARGDLFIGSGAAAGEIAGRIRHPAHFTILIPKPAVERYLS